METKKIKTHTIDATGVAAGRVASAAAKILMGKHKATYVAHLVCGEPVHIVNASKMKITGKKLTGKKFYSHSNFPGGLKTKQLKTVMGTDPTFVIRHAVERMLPKNDLRAKILKHLRITA